MTDGRINFDRVSHCYDATRAMPPEMEKAVMDKLVEIGGFMPHSRVLELGVGTGRIAAPLSDIVQSRYYGVDISRGMMSQIRGKRGGYVIPVVADVCALPFPTRVFDIVLAVHVFHLVKNWRCAVDEAERVLDSGGIMIVCGEEGVMESFFNNLKPAARKKLGGLIDKMGIKRNVPGMSNLDEAVEALKKKGASVTIPSPVEHVIQIPLAGIIALFANRTFQFLWDIPDESLKEITSGMKKVFEKTYGSLDEKVPMSRIFSFVRAAL